MAREKEIKVEITDAEEAEVKKKPETAENEDARSKGTEVEAEPKGDTPASTEEEATEEGAEPEEELTPEEKLERQAAETADKLLRVMAEFDNYKKRQARQYDDLVRSANNRLLSEILEIVDNFERALEHANGQTDLDSFRQGTQLIYNQMKDLLARHGVEPIEALGKPFDPNLHEAMMQVESDEYDEGTVAMEISKGYRQGDRVLRHSKVGVSAPPKVEEKEAEATENAEDTDRTEHEDK